MPDNTRVNELQDKLLQAMDIINAHALSSISFDKTVLCTIEDDSEKKNGKYIVSNDVQFFDAYSSDTKLRKGESVYVTIPQGDYTNQKMIIGKYTTQSEQPYNFISPFDTIFDMTDNVVLGQVEQGALVANALDKYVEDGNQEYITLYDKECNFYGYTRLGIKANFKSWIKDAVRGEYGLVIILDVKNPNIASSQELQEQEYYFTFSNLNMYGNTYNFETDYEQEIVLPLNDISGTITNIKINFYQKANFFDKFNEPLRCSQLGYLTEPNTNVYDRDDDGDYQLKENDILIEPNLFVSNIYLCFGYDISTFDNDYVEIYSQQSNTYKHSNNIANDGLAQNRKLIRIRWVHNNNGQPTDMIATADPITWDSSYEVRWYRYQIGAAAADKYCGVYWTKIDENKFSIEFDPDVEVQRERIKAIIIYNSGEVYRSNEILFENEQDLPPSAESQHIINALTIQTNDGTNGNYMVYGQDNSIKDTAYGKNTRSLSAWFDINETGSLEDEEELTGEDQGKLLLWTFPAQSTMIELLTEQQDIEEIVQNEKVVSYQIRTANPKYKIKSYYSPSYSNNTIICQYELNGRIYTTEKEFTFGPAGTMGTDQTLVIDFVGDTNAVNLENIQDVKIGIQLYDSQNIAQDMSNAQVIWRWYYHSGLSKDNYSITNNGGSIITLNKDIFYDKDEETNKLIVHLCIIEATIGDLTAYFPIPVQSGGYSYIKGPTQVIYQSNGEPSYSYEPYSLYNSNDEIVEGILWNIICKDETAKAYIGSLNENFKLKPLNIYVKDAPIYGVQAQSNGIVVWTQPILVLQNKWPNGVINAWDGESLVLNDSKSTILAAAISAGSKNSEDNTFSGVMMGNWEGQDVGNSIKKQTGIYGFYHGDMSYAFKEDGTAFIGRSGRGRIKIDGNTSVIESANYRETDGVGMKIDLYGGGQKPSISLKSNQSEMVLSASNEGSIIKMEKGNDQYICITNHKDQDPLKIGKKFKVDWYGNIEASGGAIGNWNILSNGALQSNDGKITLNTAEDGSIVIGDLDSGKIEIDAFGNGRINMSNSSVLHGGIIEAGTLRSNGNDSIGRINLDGYLTVGVYGHLGHVTSGIPEASTAPGIGMDYIDSLGNILGEIKVTAANSGLNFGKGYISVSNAGISIGCSDDNNNKTINFQKIKPENQHGIYARFA